MTVETKAFLSDGKSAKILNTNKSLAFAVVLLLLCVSACILSSVWLLNKMQTEVSEIDRSLRAEIDQLKSNVADLKQNFGFFEDLSEFDKKYNQNDIKDEINLDELENTNNKMKFDDIGGENSEEYEESNHSGYGDDDEYDSLEGLEASEKTKSSENNIYNDMTRSSRIARSVRTDQGVPIIEEPYILQRNQPKIDPSANSLNSRDNPKLKLNWNQGRKDNEFRGSNHFRHHKFAFDAAPVKHSFESFGQKFNKTESNPTMQTRRSRVFHVEDKSKAYRQVIRKDKLKKLQEARKAPEQWLQQNGDERQRLMKPTRKNLELKNGKTRKVTAIHFEGDSSSLTMGRHQEFQGNGKVKLNKNQYIHWKPAIWTNSHGMHNYFNMESGILTVNDHGLFLIYAQVFYSDDHDTNGYFIEHNDSVKFQCVTMTISSSRATKINSCYTSGLIHIQHGDRIQLRDIGNHRSVLLEPSKSFFGLIKINLMLPSIESKEIEAFNIEK